MKFAITAATAGLACSLLVPVTAHAQQNVIPPLRVTVNPCAKVIAEYRQSVVAAREAKHTAFRAAQIRFHAATSDERTQIQAAGRQARKSYRINTADERRDRANARAAAAAAYSDAHRAAKAQRRAGMSACR